MESKVTLRQTIREISKTHLQSGHLLFGQCLTAVGWVNGTIPELTTDDGLVELPMADVMNGGVVVGAGLAGKRPIYVVRYQGFQWFNAPIITNYAGKTKDMWGVSCPILIRSLAMEGGIGPVAGSSHHGIYYRMPGIKIASPMTPGEWKEVYDEFMSGDDTIYVSEHRKSYDTTDEYVDCTDDLASITIFPFSVSRMEMDKVRDILHHHGIRVNIFHQNWISPLRIKSMQVDALTKSGMGLVIDDDYENGVAKQISYELMLMSRVPVVAMGIPNKTSGFAPTVDNLPPDAKSIASYVIKLLEEI